MPESDVLSKREAPKATSTNHFFKDPIVQQKEEIFAWSKNKWFAIPKEYRVGLVVTDAAGTIVDAYCLAPAWALKQLFSQPPIQVVLSHEQITGPMGLKKREHIKHILLEIKASEQLPPGLVITEKLIDELHKNFTHLLNSIVGSCSLPVPHFDYSQVFLKALEVPVALTTGYSRQTLDCILDRQQLSFNATTAADEVADGSRFAMVSSSMTKVGLTLDNLHKVILFTDARADIDNIKKDHRYKHCWVIGVSQYSTHVDYQSCHPNGAVDQKILKEKEKIAEDILAKSKPHAVISNLSQLPLVMVAVSQALMKGKKPENTESLEIEYPNLGQVNELRETERPSLTSRI